MSCCYCNTTNDEDTVILECNHSLHSKCIVNIAMKKFKSYECVMIDKSDVYVELNKDKKSNIMTFGTNKCDGIINCPKCKTMYSLLSPHYKSIGIPMKIDKIMLLYDENDDILFYHI